MLRRFAIFLLSAGMVWGQITTINGTDAVSSSRLTINNNFAYLNSWCIDTGTVNAMACTMTAAGLVAGQVVRIKVANTNTGSTTFNLNGLGTVLVLHSGANLVAGELVGSTTIATLVYDGTNFELIGTVPIVATNAIAIGTGSGISGSGVASCTSVGNCDFASAQVNNLASGSDTNPYVYPDTSGALHLGNFPQYSGMSATGTALPGSCTQGQRWLVTGNYTIPATVPSPGEYPCVNGAYVLRTKVTGTSGEYTLGDGGTSFTFSALQDNTNSPPTVNLNIFPPSSSTSEHSTNLQMFSKTGVNSEEFNIQSNGVGTRHLFIETFALGSSTAEDSWRLGEYSQSSGAGVPNLYDFQFGFGNTGTSGSYAPFTLNKFGTMTRTYSSSVPGTPDGTSCSVLSPTSSCGNDVGYIDPTTKIETHINDAGTHSNMVQPSTQTCPGGQHATSVAISSAGVVSLTCS